VLQRIQLQLNNTTIATSGCGQTIRIERPSRFRFLASRLISQRNTPNVLAHRAGLLPSQETLSESVWCVSASGRESDNF
jgi:hypothetical protein